MRHKLKSEGKLTAIVAVLFFELLEEGLEEFIAFGLSWGIAKAISMICAVTLSKVVTRLLRKTIKLLTYKEGKDKMDKLKSILKWLFANKKSLSATISTAIATGGSIAAAWTVDGLPQIVINGFNAAPIIYTVACLIVGALTELGICGKGFEWVKTFADRIAAEKQAKELAKAEKAAQLEEQAKLRAAAEADERLKAEALAYLAEQAAKAEAEALAKKREAEEQERLQAEAEHYKKVVQLAESLRNNELNA